MKYAFYLLLTLLAAVVAAGLLHVSNGYALLAYGGTSVEMSLGTLVALMLVTFFGLYLLTTLAVKLWTYPRRLREALARKRELRARRATKQGLIDFAEGRWAESERNLMLHAVDSEMPLVTYIAAARAAQLQGEHERRDIYLRMAFEQIPEAQVAVLLTQAELQIAHKQLEQALTTLRRLQEVDPDHAFGLKLLANLYRKLGDWKSLRELVAKLRDNRVLSKKEVDRLELRAVTALLDQAGAVDGVAALWDSLPRRLRGDVELNRAYARALIRAGELIAAEAALRDALRSNWDEELLALYGLAVGEHPKRQLGRVEDWLAERGESAALLLTAGRLCTVAKLWGKARGYFESSIVLGGRPEAYEELGKLLRQLDEGEDALRAYSDGLAVALGHKVKRYRPAKPRPRRIVKN
ncbi:MAG TPA: heme biosynthesis HemY N-terminal domain-containing protein [Gammaproteobacteria bacterium]|nr:heme biosynthesis HemY N-terminal domain-containing protein [Gammaproteobacteria bacterium]